MSKKVSDYPVTLYRVGNEMLLAKDGYEKPYQIRSKPYMAKPTKAGFVLMDDSRIKAADLMVAKNAMREVSAEFDVWCLADQVEDAKALVVQALRAHLEKHRDMFIKMLAALESPVYVAVPNTADEQMVRWQSTDASQA